MEQEHIVKQVGDCVSACVAVGTLMAILPPIAAGLTIIWTAIRIYETKTFQRLFRGPDADD